MSVGRHQFAGPDALVGDDLLDRLAAQVDLLVGQTARLLGLGSEITAPDAGTNATVLDGYVGPGYAEPSAGSTDALRLIAHTEGVIVDPVYSAKALHALREADGDGPVVFWHTGGIPALFAVGGR